MTKLITKLKRGLYKSLVALVILGIIFVFGSYIFPETISLDKITGHFTNQNTTNSNPDVIKIANWNLQIFGVTKAGNQKLMDVYTQIMTNYDIVFVQEIRDITDTAFTRLCSQMQSIDNGYKCKISSKAGRSNSKEQYGIIYNNKTRIIEFTDFNLQENSNDNWERPPIKVSFSADEKNYTFTVYNIHAKPEDVQSELSYLEYSIKNEGNIIVLGDLNADCSYYNNEKETEFQDRWFWAINDSEDTTVKDTNCAYDRIIINDDAKEEFVNYEINRDSRINSNVSDHYPVSLELSL